VYAAHRYRRVSRRFTHAPRLAGALIACLTIGSPLPLAAQASVLERDALPRGDAATLRLATLYALVGARSPQLEAARALARAADARVPGARRPPDPQLQFGFMNRALPSLAPMDPLGMTQLQLMQMVPVAGKLSLAGRVAGAQAMAAGERAEDVRWEVRSRVAMAFYELYATDRALSVAIESRRLLQDIAKTAQTMYTVGDGRQPDVLKAQVEVARMTEDIVRMRTMRVVATAMLAGLVNAIPDSTLASPELPLFPTQLPPLDSLQRLAEQNRPMIRAGIAEVRAADAGAKLATREIWPDLQVGVQYGQRNGPMGTERMGSLMIGASLPVFARSRQLKMREEAEAMKAMAVADLSAMRALTRARVAELYANVVRARNLADLFRASVLPQSRAAVTSSLASYRAGQVNLMTLLDNQMTVNSYQQELFALDAEQGKAIAELEMLIGRELFDVDAAPIRAAGSDQ
jgi:outer membrane protein, heavy metal efflux system